MAIDSKEKRASISSISRRIGKGVVPDAAGAQAWRQVVGFGYYGILVGGGPTETILDYERKMRGVARGSYRGLT